MNNINIKAIEVSLDIDYAKMQQEFLSIPEDRWQVSVAPNLVGPGTHTYKSLFLTRNDTDTFTDFKSAKSVPHNEWYWDDSLNLPYTKSVVYSLPARSIGIVRIMIADGPLPLHVDSDNTTPDDYTYRLGLTVAPLQKYAMQLGDTVVTGSQYFFDDGILHGFPDSSEVQMSIRVFGDFEYSKFKTTKVYQ